MKKFRIFTVCLLLGCVIFGCSGKKDVDTRANVSYENQKITNSKSLTVADLYNYVVENQNEKISKKILTKVMEKNINFSDPNTLNLYKQYLNDYFTETFVENDTYKYYGNFKEDLLVKYLKSESYQIKCGEGVSSGYLNDKYFSCDYSNYIDEEVNYDIYSKILKIDYIINNKSNLIDKYNARKVIYYSVARGSNDDVLDKLKGYVSSFVENVSSTDDSVVKNIEDIAKIDRSEDLEEVDKEYAYLKTSTDSPNFEYLNKFTTCGDVRCSVEEGLAYRRNLVMDQEYYITEVVIKGNTEILFESARNVLFGDNVENYLYTIGEKTYLINPASYNSTDKRVTDIILYEGTTQNGHSSSSNYYLAEVEVIDSDSAFDEKVLVAEMLIEKISDSTILEECFENIEIDIFDEEIRKNFISVYGEYKKGE